MERSNDSTPRTNAYLRLPPDLLDRIDAEAKRRLVSRNFLVAGALERFLESEATGD